MKRILIVGSGDVACRAIPWLARRFKVYALVRNAESAAMLRLLGAYPLLGDLDDRGSLRRLAGIAHAVLHFAPPPGEGTYDLRTAHLLAELSRSISLPQRLVYISTTGVYGDCCGVMVEETRTCHPQTLRAQRRCDAERRLRQFGRRRGACVSVLRAPGIYATERLPRARLQRGEPVLMADEDVYTNHIHADDLARLACLALFRGRPGRVYHAVDNSEMKMGDYFDLLASHMGLPRPARVRRDVLEQQVSALTLSFMSESRRLSNRRIHEELRVRLRYPSVHDGLSAAVESHIRRAG